MESIILIDRAFNIFKRYKNIAIIAISLIIGFSVSSGLLIFNGKELVNALIYIGVIVAIPFLLSVVSFVRLFFTKSNLELEGFRVSFLFGTFFSLGALLSLLFIITTSDIAFGWATTLDIKAKSLSNALNAFAIWKSFCSSCEISQHLVELSQFNRLGFAVSKEQIAHAKELGSWWRYLAMLILTYGVIFRAILYFIAKSFKIKPKDILFQAEDNKESLEEISTNYINRTSLKELQNREFRLLGYYVDTNNLELKGSEDAKDIVVAVKSWEPPILDFFDYLEELQDSSSGSKISIYLVGLNGDAKSKDVDIWLRKLNELKLNYEVIV